MNAFALSTNYFEYNLEIGTKIEIERRTVTSLPSLFGEIGGLYDFFALFILLFISSFQANSFLVNLIKDLFLTNKSGK